MLDKLSVVLAFPKAYELFSNVLAPERRLLFFFEHKPGSKILDVGCGPGNNAHHFLDSEYTGVDLSPAYIEEATRKFRMHGNVRFFCSDANVFLDARHTEEKFDLIFMCGVLQQLNDDEALNVLYSISKLLAVGGEFRSIDNVWLEEQSAFVRYMLSINRGRHVRTVEGYRQLIGEHFSNATYELRHDLLRIPYDHIVFSAYT